MAKELPYFKFEPSEYIAGNIQDCSFEAQGVFINICSLYWIRLGDMTYASALQRICKGIPKALDELCKAGILKVEDDKIIISFLDIQLNEFQDTSKKRRNAANKRWNDASALQVQSKSNAIREEKKREKKIREDEIRGDENPSIFEENFERAFDAITCDRYKNIFKEIDLGRELQLFRVKCDNDKATYYSRDYAGLRTAFQYQLKTAEKNGKQTSKKGEHPSVAAARNFAERHGIKPS